MNKTGFGFLRFPYVLTSGEKTLDYPRLNRLVDQFLKLGGNYFDTAYTYLDGLSEEAIRLCLVNRHPRSNFRLADKLPGWKVTSHEDCGSYFRQQQQRCGTEYFDVYLIHWLNARHYEIAEKTGQFDFLQQLKDAGLARAIGFSYHDGPELLDRILTEHPECDYVQLQINYLDWDSVSIQSGACYETAYRHGKRVIVMEPLRGGNLARLPHEVEQLFPRHPSPAAQALRFVTSLEAVEVVLSGMNEEGQILDNLQDFLPITSYEQELFRTAAAALRKNNAIGCTGCNYCSPNCPAGIPIPRYFSLYNEYARNPDDGWKMEHSYHTLVHHFPGPDACIQCGLCQENCPQKLEIRELLQKVATSFSA